MEKANQASFVFVLMPFSDEFRDLYEVAIKPACKDAGVYCERVDEQIFVRNILGQIYDQIAKADIIVAEMTGRNPNVFYETGYAHALNKPVVLLTRDADDIPFDLKHYPHIVYGGKLASLKSQLEAVLRKLKENPKESFSKYEEWYTEWRLSKHYIETLRLYESENKHISGTRTLAEVGGKTQFYSVKGFHGRGFYWLEYHLENGAGGGAIMLHDVGTGICKGLIIAGECHTHVLRCYINQWLLEGKSDQYNPEWQRELARKI